MNLKAFGRFTKTEKDTFNLNNNAFLRAGAWFGIIGKPQRFASAADIGQWGATDLFLWSRRGGVSSLGTNELMQLIPVYKGEKIAYSVTVKPTELTVNTDFGKIRFCFASPSLMMVKGENGLGLMLWRKMEMHQMARRRGEKGFETAYGYVCSIVYNPVRGSIDMDADWDFDSLSMPLVKGEVKPDENGEFLLSIEESTHFGRIRAAYPSYEEALADVTKAWNAYFAARPALAAEYADDREETAYLTWSHLASPAGLSKRPLLFMRQSGVASSWQLCETAVVLKNDLPLAVELLCNSLDLQGPTGQIPDTYSDQSAECTRFKPPIQGWALEMLMQTHDLQKEVPAETLTYLYEGYSRWADWFTKYRDDDGDGIPQMEHGDETGNDDSPLFLHTYCVDAPELSAFLALLYEKLGDLAGLIGRDAEKEAWYARSKELIDKMIKLFWNGERFIAREHENHDNIIDVKALEFYRPILLGKRLPPEILDKLTADLMEEGHYLSIAGFTVEDMSDSPYSTLGTGRGKILPSDNILIITGLYLAGKKAEAKIAAKKYIEGFRKVGTMYYSGGFIGSWAPAAWQILADLCCNG